MISVGRKPFTKNLNLEKIGINLDNKKRIKVDKKYQTNIKNIFAIGDIHGCLNQLVTLQDKIFNYPQYNKEEDLLLYLGDYIDRGPSSKDVINHILQLQTEGIKSIFLMGNHEQFMIDFLFNKINNLSNWLMNGADQTFKSYDIEVAEFIKDGFEDDNIDKLRNIFLSKLTKGHVYFFKNLKLTYIMGDYLFVHAGINPEKSLSEQNKMDFLWSRSDKFFDKNFTLINPKKSLQIKSVNKAIKYVKIGKVKDAEKAIKPAVNYLIKMKCKKIVLGWTGTFSSIILLDLLRDILIELNKTEQFKVLLITNFDYSFPGIDMDIIRWDKESEVEDLHKIDIGLYPLSRDKWTLGKGGLKILQYMSIGIPSVATNHGTAIHIIKNGKTGFLVNGKDEWISILNIANIVASQFEDVKVVPAKTKDMVQQDKRNKQNTYILNFWEPKISLEEGIKCIIKKLK